MTEIGPLDIAVIVVTAIGVLGSVWALTTAMRRYTIVTEDLKVDGALKYSAVAGIRHEALRLAKQGGLCAGGIVAWWLTPSHAIALPQHTVWRWTVICVSCMMSLTTMLDWYARHVLGSQYKWTPSSDKSTLSENGDVEQEAS